MWFQTVVSIIISSRMNVLLSAAKGGLALKKVELAEDGYKVQIEEDLKVLKRGWLSGRWLLVGQCTCLNGDGMMISR
jgi:hypothetical protein